MILLEIEAVLPNLILLSGSFILQTSTSIPRFFFRLPFCSYAYQNGWNKFCQKGT